MTAIIFLILVFLLLIVGFGIFGYLGYRKKIREGKSYERGLKMVPLLIHLPPSSDDIDVGSRDARDVVEETISKAESLYNILTTIAEKENFKSKLHGQKHIGFEIVAVKGRIHFYVVSPVPLIPVVEQALLSAYPTSRLEEVQEHNVFSEVGKITGTMGGEFKLKEDAANPIATFQESKREALQSLLNAMTNLTSEDGASVQILVRPAGAKWSKNALGVAKEKKDNKKKKSISKTFGTYLREVPGALVKVPESTEGEKKDDSKPISNLEQSHVDAIEEKTRHPVFETKIRMVVSSNISTRAQTVMNNLVASFTLFDAPGKNGFKFSPAKDIDKFVTSFIFRFFSPEDNDMVLNSVELATIFHLPDQRSTPTSQLSRQASKQVDGPSNAPTEGLLLGYNEFRGVKKEIRLTDLDRRRHLYVVGQTGTGKSVVLENMAVQDMMSGRGFAFIDPHGDTAETLLSKVPKHRAEDVVYFSPGEMEHPLGLNLFEWKTEEQKDFLIQEAINMLEKLYDPNNQGIIGPRYHHIFRNSALLLMADPAGSSLIDITKLFRDQNYVHQKLKHTKDQTVREFWLKEIPQSQKSNEFGEVKSWFVSKFGAFLSNEMMRNVIGQTRSSFDLRDIMDNKKILLVNLSKGRTGELNSKLLGMIFVMQFQAAAMSRVDVPEDQREDFSLYVDEFQNFSTDSFATILSEARKFRLNLIVANQFISQLDEQVRDAVFGNVGSMISLRTGANDADFLVKQFSPVFDQEDLVKLPNYNGVARVMMNNVPTSPFSLSTYPAFGEANIPLGQAIKHLSNAKYGKPRAVVEKEILDRLASSPEAPGMNQNRFGGARGGPAGGMPPGQPTTPPVRPTASSSLLDDLMGGSPKPKPMPTQNVAQPQPVSAPAPAPAATTQVSAPQTKPVATMPAPNHQANPKPAVSKPEPVAKPILHKIETPQASARPLSHNEVVPVSGRKKKNASKAKTKKRTVLKDELSKDKQVDYINALTSADKTKVVAEPKSGVVNSTDEVDASLDRLKELGREVGKEVDLGTAAKTSSSSAPDVAKASKSDIYIDKDGVIHYGADKQ